MQSAVVSARCDMIRASAGEYAARNQASGFGARALKHEWQHDQREQEDDSTHCHFLSVE
jgi:hypothetical protein